MTNDQTETLEYHPLANIFPLMDDDDIVKMAKSIRKVGQRKPIVMLDGKILDGRNRYRACFVADREPKFIEFNENITPFEYVMAENLDRRHLTTSQRAIIAAKIALDEGVDQKDAAAALSVSRNTVLRHPRCLGHRMKLPLPPARRP